MIKYEEPLAHQLIQVTKKYLSAFSQISNEIPLERYHYVLLLIDENKECLTQKALTEILQVDKSFMVSMIDHLTEHGFVIREANPEDRREHIIKLTSKAKTIIPKINQAFKELNHQAFLNIPEEKVKTFFEVIDNLQRNFNIKSTHEIVLDYKKLK